MLARIGAVISVNVCLSSRRRIERARFDVRGHLFTIRVIAVGVVDVNADRVQCS